MKSIVQTLIGIVFATATYCQHSQLPLAIEDEKMSAYLQKKGNATLHVKVINSTKPVEGIQVKYTTVRFGPESQRTSYTKLNAKGEATIVLTDQLPYQQVFLEVENYVYTGLLVNTNLSIQVDASKLKGKEAYLYSDALMLMGADAGLNEAINKNTLFKKKETEALWNILHNASISAANKMIPVQQFLKTSDSVYQCLQKIIAEYTKDNPQYDWAIINETNSNFFGLTALAFVNKTIPDNIYNSIVAHKPYFTSNDGTGFYRQLQMYLTTKADNDKLDIQKLLYANNQSLTNDERAVLDSISLLEGLNESSDNKKLLNHLYSKRYKLFRNQINLARDNQNLANINKSIEGSRADIIRLRLMEESKDRFRETYPVILKSIKTPWAKSYVQKQLDEAIVKQNNRYRRLDRRIKLIQLP